MWKICACVGLMVALVGGVSVPAQVPRSDDLAAEIDAIVDSACGAAGTRPAATCDDATFLRRVWLDLAGRVPPLLAARDFLKDQAPDKRARLVDELLASEEFADHWGRVFAEFLTDRRAVAQPPYNGRVLHDYLRKALAADTSYQQIARDLIAGGGANDASGPANFLLCYQVDPAQLTGAVAKKFLGVSLECAQCHHHPFDRWTRDDFWGIAACFARTRQMSSNDGQLFAVVEARAGELEIDAPPAAAGDDASEAASTAEAPAEAPPQKKQVGPRLLDGTTLAADGPRRAELAAWITGGGNVDFARQAANVVWRSLFSQRLAAAHGNDSPFANFEAELLDRLATAFAAGDFRFKRLLPAVMLSRAYARESAVPSGDAHTTEHPGLSPHPFARYQVRPLSADQLYQSLVQVSGYAGGYEDMSGQPGDPQTDFNSSVDPAVELLGARALTVQRSLALLNSDYLRQASQMGARHCLSAVGSRITPAHVEYVFLATLSRPPDAEEAKAMLELVTSASTRLQGLEDLYWLLLNSAEFSFNH